MATGVPLPHWVWGLLPAGPLGPVNVRVWQPSSLETGLVITTAMRWPTAPWKVAFALLPGAATFSVTAGPLARTVQQLLVAVGAALAVAGPLLISSITLPTVTVLRPAANALPSARSLMAPPSYNLPVPVGRPSRPSQNRLGYQGIRAAGVEIPLRRAAGYTRPACRASLVRS